MDKDEYCLLSYPHIYWSTHTYNFYYLFFKGELQVQRVFSEYFCIEFLAYFWSCNKTCVQKIYHCWQTCLHILLLVFLEKERLMLNDLRWVWHSQFNESQILDILLPVNQSFFISFIFVSSDLKQKEKNSDQRWYILSM